jgi:hypothetical protein
MVMGRMMGMMDELIGLLVKVQVFFFLDFADLRNGGQNTVVNSVNEVIAQ